MSTSPSSAEPAKVSKRKGTRSVSTLTPSQLARKRANDREAQRAIRARTKEHIERLERELEDYKNRWNRDETVQQLLRKNRLLESQLQELRIMCATAGIGFNINNGAPAGSGVSSRASSFGNGATGEYTSAPTFTQSYLPTPEPGPSEAYLTSGVVMPAVSAPSVVSSPCSSTGHPEDYMPGAYIPTSVPMMGGSVMPSNSMSCLGEEPGPKMEFEDIDGTTPADHGYPPPNAHHSSSAAYLHHPTSWPMTTTPGSVYPSPTYYTQSPTL